MSCRSVGWGAALIVALILGSASKVTKAERALSLAVSDPAQVAVAVERADAAVEKGGAGDPAAWAVRGRAYAMRSRSGASPDAAADLAVAVDSFERAVASKPAGAVHATLSDEVPSLDAELAAALVNDVEARAWADADRLLGLALQTRALSAALRGADPERDAAVRRLGVQITAALGRTGEAQQHYAAFATASGGDDLPLASLVARATAETGDVPGALAFVAPLSARYPDDPSILRADVELLTAAGRTADAIARIEGAQASLDQSVSGAYLAASLYDAAGEAERARASWNRVLELDPRHVDARVALGRSLTAVGVEKRAELQARAEELDQRRPPRELLDLIRAANAAWADAEQLLTAALGIDASSKPAAEALIALYERRVAAVDPETATRTERTALDADTRKLEAARAALAQQGGRP
ncbi:MAG: hypothetical protein ABMB14_36045 [Myxococcota bacterium]